MDFIANLVSRLAANPKTIVLPEGNEPRTLQAVEKAIANKVGKIILLGDEKEILEKAKALGLNNIAQATIINPKTAEKKQHYADLLVELRKHKGMTLEKALTVVEDPLYFAALVIKNGDADGYLAGAINTTGDVLRPALQIIKTKKGISTVSGAFLLFSKEKQYGKDGLVVVADCAVTPLPDAKQLAEIAIASAETAQSLAGIEPKVALLSYSTKGSAKGENIDRVTEATQLAKEMAPKIAIDGELQADAALVKSVGELKAPGSQVAGSANVLVFPSLEAGNIGYKLVQRLGGAVAIGPILQGMAAPVNDLSRGSSPEDIYNMIVITAGLALAN